MDNLEVSLTDISEEVTTRLSKKNKLKGLKENLKVTHAAGQVSKKKQERKMKIFLENLLLLIKINKLSIH